MTFLLALLAIAGLYIGAPLYIRIIGGIQYESAINALRILSLASGITIVSGYFASKLLSEKREKSIFVISFIAFLVNIIANIVFIPQFSFIATSWITVLTQLIVLIGYSLL
jgi:O-antigen/teichoic acid export membrane protein